MDVSTQGPGPAYDFGAATGREARASSDLRPDSGLTEKDERIRAWALKQHRLGEYTWAVHAICADRVDDQEAWLDWLEEHEDLGPAPMYTDRKDRFEDFKKQARMLKDAGILGQRMINEAVLSDFGDWAEAWLRKEGINADYAPPGVELWSFEPTRE